MTNVHPFIGDKEIIAVEDLARTTPMGDKILKVHYNDQTSEVFTEQTLNRVRTEKATDATKLRELRVVPVAEQILVILREANLKIEEIEYLFNLVGSSIDKNFNDATNKLWNVEFAGQRTFLEADDILKANAHNNSNKE